MRQNSGKGPAYSKPSAANVKYGSGPRKSVKATRPGHAGKCGFKVGNDKGHK